VSTPGPFPARSTTARLTTARLTTARLTTARAAACLAAVLVVVLGATGCSDLLDTGQADAVIQLEADDQDQVLLTRQDVLASAPTWGGTRVGEQTTEPNETALEFTLPGENLELALSAISELDARVVGRTIDVDPSQVDRTPTTTEPGQDPPDPAERQVRLRVEVTEAAPAGAGAFVQLLMALFSVIGVVATVGWVLRWRRGRHPTAPPPRRNIDRVDLREEPPTQETPRVPPQW
jgi:hypothetical protein